MTVTVYTGSTLTNLTRIADSGTRVLFAAQAGMTYHIAVEQAEPGDGGQFSFSLLLSHLRLTSPTNGAVLHQPIDLVLSAAGETEDGGFELIDFLADGSSVGTATNAPFSFVWSNAPLGTQALTLRATNSAGWVHETLPSVVVIRPQNDDFQARTNLVNWTTVAIDTLLGNGQSFVDDEAADFPWRFYRVLPLEAALANPRLRVGAGALTGDGTFSVQIIGPGGQPFVLESSTNLVNWTEIARSLLIGDSLDHVDAQAASFRERFYRALPFR